VDDLVQKCRAEKVQHIIGTRARLQEHLDSVHLAVAILARGCRVRQPKLPPALRGHVVRVVQRTGTGAQRLATRQFSGTYRMLKPSVEVASNPELLEPP
jgi:hypothetical protein